MKTDSNNSKKETFKMTKLEVRDFLEDRLGSHKEHVMDSNDRLVWITDVTDVVLELLSQPNSN